MMSSRERLLTALGNETPDRLPCQVHSWMSYYLTTYLRGMDQYQAYEHFDMDAVIYVSPRYIYREADLSNWDVKVRELGRDQSGNFQFEKTITTPKGTLTTKGARNEFTSWETKHLITDQRDFELWQEFVPIPEAVDWSPVIAAKERIGDRGIVRSSFFDFGQGSPWQSFCYMFGTEQAILATYDDPDWVHGILDDLLAKKLAVIDRGGENQLDLVETGGGAGSSTVISPTLFQEFCLPYDQKQHAALRASGTKVVYHLCGGLMPMLELVVQNGANGLETMTPPGMGGDCDLAEASKRVGDRLFFIGGFDQNAGFEQGTPQTARELVYQCHRACPDGGYICSPSDHFFFGSPENIQAFVDAAKECTY